MNAAITMASIGAAAILFYLRFLFALSREYQLVRLLYLARIQPAVVESAVVEIELEDKLSARAA